MYRDTSSVILMVILVYSTITNYITTFQRMPMGLEVVKTFASL